MTNSTPQLHRYYSILMALRWTTWTRRLLSIIRSASASAKGHAKDKRSDPLLKAPEVASHGIGSVDSR